MTEETLLLVAVGLCFGMVVLAAKAGFSTALGAFVMGAILAETIEADVIHRLVTPLKNLFSAVFFVSVGMLIQPAVLGQHWWKVLIIAACIILFKSTAATTGVLLSGKPLKMAIQSGFCFCQIGEFSFIIAGLGNSFGVIDANLYPIIVSVSILTTFVTPYMIKGALPFYNWLEPKVPARVMQRLEQYGRHSGGDDDSRASIGDFIRKQVTNILLYGVILAALSLLSVGILRPFLDRLFADLEIPQIWSRLLGLVGTLILMSPFLWAVAVKDVSRKKIREIIDTYRFSLAVVIPILLLRYFVALFSVGIVVAGYVDMAVGFLMVIAIIVVAVVLFTRKADSFYTQIEERFTKNLNSRQAQASFRIPTGMEGEFAMERLRVTPASPLAGKTLAQAEVRDRYGANIVTIERGDNIIDMPAKTEIMMPFDVLTVIGTDEQVSAIRGDIEKEADMLVHDHSDHEMHMYRYHVEAGGPLCGLAIRTSSLATKHHAMVIAI
jgi:CPA2 family monovalent cation:H+ antiporter-2